MREEFNFDPQVDHIDNNPSNNTLAALQVYLGFAAMGVFTIEFGEQLIRDLLVVVAWSMNSSPRASGWREGAETPTILVEVFVTVFCYLMMCLYFSVSLQYSYSIRFYLGHATMVRPPQPATTRTSSFCVPCVVRLWHGRRGVARVAVFCWTRRSVIEDAIRLVDSGNTSIEW